MSKISFVTVCMNRLYHLCETMPVNIMQNRNFPDIEFVLLDYNSQDGLDSWVQANLMEHVESGLVKYYKTFEPAYFNVSHSKNMGSNLASGDIFCMIDADNYAGLDFAHWVNAVFDQEGKNAVIAISESDSWIYPDLGGKITAHRELFTAVHGFDESMTGYGMDDVDLVNRLQKAGGKKISLEKIEHKKYISHAGTDRLKNYYLANKLENLYYQINEATGFQVTVLYIMKDDTYQEMNYEFNESLKSDAVSKLGGWHVEKAGIKKGTVERRADGLVLIGSEPVFYTQQTERTLVSFVDSKKVVWSRVDEDNPFYLRILFGYSHCMNHIKFLENDQSAGPVNAGGWGRGVVYRNFDYSTPIYAETLPERKALLSHI